MLILPLVAIAGAAFGVTMFVTDKPPAEPAALSQPWAASAYNVESGLLWQINNSTPIAYRLVPTQLSWRSADFWDHELPDGSRLVLRHRLTLLTTLVEHGPETFYIGIAGSPSLELWNKAGTNSLYFGAGGGVGLIDSKGVTGGQGQNFTLNWFIRGGVEHITSSNLHLTAGFMYQHMSNGGQTTPNPGINALGLMLGCSWAF